MTSNLVDDIEELVRIFPLIVVRCTDQFDSQSRLAFGRIIYEKSHGESSGRRSKKIDDARVTRLA